MGNYTQIYIQIVFAVKGRANLISPRWKDSLHKYISGIITAKGHKAIIVNGMPDHIHVFIGLNPAMALSDLVRDIKNNSSKYVNESRWVRGKFRWQSGYGAFSYSNSQIERVYNYILHQEKHHRNKSFNKEFHDFLEDFEIEYQEKYLFDWLN